MHYCRKSKSLKTVKNVQCANFLKMKLIQGFITEKLFVCILNLVWSGHNYATENLEFCFPKSDANVSLVLNFFFNVIFQLLLEEDSSTQRIITKPTIDKCFWLSTRVYITDRFAVSMYQCTVIQTVFDSCRTKMSHSTNDTTFLNWF